MSEKHPETDTFAEDNANLIRWSVHILGMDDVLAMPTHAEAVAKAKQINEQLFDYLARQRDQNNVLCFAYAAPWPRSDEDHAISMNEGDPI